MTEPSKFQLYWLIFLDYMPWRMFNRWMESRRQRKFIKHAHDLHRDRSDGVTVDEHILFLKHLTWDDFKKDEKPEQPLPHICKHCNRQISLGVHIEGMNRGKQRCDPQDSGLIYGYNAEAIGDDCKNPCVGAPNEY